VAPWSVYKTLFYFEAYVHESILLLSIRLCANTLFVWVWVSHSLPPFIAAHTFIAHYSVPPLLDPHFICTMYTIQYNCE